MNSQWFFPKQKWSVTSRSAILMVLLSLPVVLHAQQSYGRITKLIGSASIRGTTRARPVRIHTPFRPGDTLMTGDESRCEITFDGSRIIRLDENSTVAYNSFGSADTGASSGHSFTGLSGSLWVDVKKLLKTQHFDMKTPTSVAAIRGTAYNLHCSANGSDYLVFEGTVATTVAGSSEEPRLATPGTRVAIVKDIETFMAAEEQAYKDFIQDEQDAFEDFMRQEQDAFDEFSEEQTAALNELRESFTSAGSLYVAQTSFDRSQVVKREWISWNLETRE